MPTYLCELVFNSNYDNNYLAGSAASNFHRHQFADSPVQRRFLIFMEEGFKDFTARCELKGLEKAHQAPCGAGSGGIPEMGNLCECHDLGSCWKIIALENPGRYPHTCHMCAAVCVKRSRFCILQRSEQQGIQATSRYFLRGKLPQELAALQVKAPWGHGDVRCSSNITISYGSLMVNHG